MRRISALPNLLTLANAFCGLLAIAKAIDALTLSGADPAIFYVHIEKACWFIFLGMLFDALDGKVARMTGGSSEFGAQLDSFSDALTFGCAPALLAKVLIEHEGPIVGYNVHPRLHMLAAAGFALMAILRLARFNLETTPDEKSHHEFKGLPSPAAAGAVVSTLLFYLLLRRPAQIETADGAPTPLGRMIALVPELRLDPMPWWSLALIAVMLPLLGFLMVSRVRYAHAVAVLTRKGSFTALVYLVFAGFLLLAAPIPVLFVLFVGFVLSGLVRHVVTWGRPSPPSDAPLDDDVFAAGSRH